MLPRFPNRLRHGRHACLAALAVAAGLLAPAADLSADPWNPPERVTNNTIEDRTTSGSLLYPCLGEAYAVWMQEQSGAGWRIVWSQRDGQNGWREPEAIDPGNHPDYGPRIGQGPGLGAAWQRNSGSASEIIYAAKAGADSWIVEPVTQNLHEDLTPDIALADPPHIVWAGLDDKTQQGKIYHAVRSGPGWVTERLIDSELGDFWTGANPRIDVGGNGDVHVVYRGGNFGIYHLHYARKHGNTWTYQTLASPNGNDFSVDVVAEGSHVVVAMSGNDCFGCFTRTYIRESTDGGVTFGQAQLVSGNFSASLENMTVGVNGLAIAASEVSGNLYTGNLLYTLVGQRPPELLPPMDSASESPSAEMSNCIPGTPAPGIESVLYINHQNAGADSAEVYFLASPLIGGIEDETIMPVARGLRLQAAPNPFSAWTRITVEGSGGFIDPVRGEAAIYDMNGRLIRRLVPTSGTLLWDGISDKGEPAPSGIYWLQVRSGDETATRSLVHVR